jgi:lysophospholipase L1-like esterase
MTSATESKDSPKPRSGKKRRRVLFRCFAIGIGLGFAFIIAEIALRLLGFGVPHLYAPDAHCGSRLRPSTEGVWNLEGQAEISINSLGFRGKEITVAKPKNVIRIATLGDSFIEALQVNEAQSFCAQLHDSLAKDRGSDQAQYEIINCGVSGYGTAQQLQMIRHHVLPLKPDVVLLAVFPDNDIRNNHRLLERDPARPYFTVSPNGELELDVSFRKSKPFVVASSWYERQKSSLVNLSRVVQLMKWLKQSSPDGVKTVTETNLADTLVQNLLETKYTYSPSSEINHKEAWSITERLIQEVSQLCIANEIQLYVFTVSSPVQVHPDQQLREQIQAQTHVPDLFYSEHRIVDLCSKSEIKCLPLASKLQAVVDDSGEFLHGFSNTCLGFGHWNASGHKAAADIVARWLLRDDDFDSLVKFRLEKITR